MYGGDEAHALSAWTSTRHEIDAERRERIPALLRMLAENGHETPFEKSALHFLVRTDVATHIHMLKHRIGVSVNAESARYKQLRTPTCYVPTDVMKAFGDALEERFHEAVQDYNEWLDILIEAGTPRARAKEVARYFLPYSNQLTSDVMFNFRSFVHFQRLRNEAHAQLEVREVAQRMVELVSEVGGFEHSLAAFGLR